MFKDYWVIPNWLVASAESLEKCEILHISCSYLNNVNVSKAVKIRKIHDLSNNRQTCYLSSLNKKVDALLAKTLE